MKITQYDPKMKPVSLKVAPRGPPKRGHHACGISKFCQQHPGGFLRSHHSVKNWSRGPPSHTDQTCLCVVIPPEPCPPQPSQAFQGPPPLTASCIHKFHPLIVQTLNNPPFHSYRQRAGAQQIGCKPRVRQKKWIIATGVLAALIHVFAALPATEVSLQGTARRCRTE